MGRAEHSNRAIGGKKNLLCLGGCAMTVRAIVEIVIVIVVVYLAVRFFTKRS